MKRAMPIFGLRALWFGMVLLSLSGNAQQDALYSQYMFNPFMINPAYAGSRDAISGTLLLREQWRGIEGAPSTQTFSIHSPVYKNKMALGLNLFNDGIGPTRNTGMLMTYAYHLKLGKAKLAFGIRGGFFNSRLDVNKLSYVDPNDRFIATGSVQTLVPTFDFGSYLYTNRFFTGISITHLAENRINYPNLPNDAFIVMRRHIMYSLGAAVPIGSNTVFKPSMLLKYTHAAPLNIDLNASFLFNKVFWLGAGYRSSKAAVLLVEYNIREFMRVGYSYDIVFNRLKSFTTGTHEIMIGFDLNLKKTSSISPRYL